MTTPGAADAPTSADDPLPEALGLARGAADNSLGLKLLAGLPLGGGSQASIDTDRFGKLLGADWGWWRTVTGNLAKMEELLGERAALIPDNRAYEPVAQAARLLEIAVETPKSMKWKLRANVGERVRWYELPEEVAH